MTDSIDGPAQTVTITAVAQSSSTALVPIDDTPLVVPAETTRTVAAEEHEQRSNAIVDGTLAVDGSLTLQEPGA